MLRSIVSCAAICLMVAVNGAAQDVDIRAKDGVSFSKYATYAWAPHLDVEGDHPVADGSALDLTIKKAADAELKRKGYERVEREESPDLMINYVGFGTDMTDIEGITKELAPGVKWIGDPQAHSMRSYREGTLVFEVVDTATEEMVWSGWVTELARTFEKLRAKASKATRRVFTHFPEN
jgi:hypothetical protein